MSLAVKLQVFEGPLDLLLYLIEKNKVIIDKEIINNSLSGYETCVKYGEKIGIKLK